MSLINNDRVVRAQQRVTLHLGQQNAVGHQLNSRASAGGVGKTHFGAHDAPRRVNPLAKFLSNARRDRPRRQPPRLRVADELSVRPTKSATRFKAHLRQLRGFARARRAAQHNHLPAGDSCKDLVLAVRDGEQLIHRGEMIGTKPWPGMTIQGPFQACAHGSVSVSRSPLHPRGSTSIQTLLRQPNPFQMPRRGVEPLTFGSEDQRSIH